MATIASLIVEISAKSIKLKKGLASATSKIKAFAKKSAKVLAGIGAFIGVGAVAAVVAITKTVNKYAAEIDKLAKTSSKLGVPVKALQKLQYQAELTGVSADTMNMALQRMTRRTSEAAKGTGEAKNALKELRLDANKLAQLSPDEQFYEISRAMKQISNQGDKVRLAMKIFDTEGVSLVNTMNGNLNRMGEEFDSLGISITGSATKMVEAYNDSKTKIGAIFSGFGIQLTAQLAEPFTRLIQWISNIIIEMGGMEVAANKFAGLMLKAIKISITGVQSLISTFTKLENLMLRIEQISLAPAVLGEAVAQKATGSDVVGVAAERTLKIDQQIAKNTAALANNEVIKSLDKLIKSLDSNIESSFSGGVEVIAGPAREASSYFTKAANDVSFMADKTKVAAEKTTKLAVAAERAAQALSPIKTTISASSHYSKIGGLNPGLSGLSIGGKQSVSSNVVSMNTAKDLAEKSVPSIGQFTINMQTDAGEISGELFGEPKFISSLKAFSDKQTNKEARAVTI